MKATELRVMSEDLIAVTLKDCEKHLFQLRFQSATDRLETPSEIRKAKKDIARILTEKRRRELVKIHTMTGDELAKAALALANKPDGPGKRRVTRESHRLSGLLEGKTKEQAAKPAGKGS